MSPPRSQGSIAGGFVESLGEAGGTPRCHVNENKTLSAPHVGGCAKFFFETRFFFGIHFYINLRS